MSRGGTTLDEAIETFATNPEVLVGVDFDGTLSPLAEHPDLATPDPRAVRALRAIAGQSGRVLAVVSGRSFADLIARVGDVDGAIYVGEHGNDTGDAGPEPDPLVREMALLIQRQARALPGAVVEIKNRSVTFHYRKVAAPAAEPALEVIRAWAQSQSKVEMIEGKKVLELTTATRTKGDAIRDLAGSRPILYIGDDTTDETVFSVLGPGDLGIKVGEGETAASYRVEDVAGVVTILEKIALASG